MSCLIYKEFHQSKYIEVVSNLQIQNIIQDYKDWHFKASVVEAENPKSKLLKWSSQIGGVESLQFVE